MMDRVLVTGGSGFVGTNLIQHCLERGALVLNIDIRPPRNPVHREYWQECDILDRQRLAEAVAVFRPVFLFHLAARTDLEEKRRIEGYAVNTDGVRSLIRAIETCGTVKRSIFASSQLVRPVGNPPRHETDYAPDTLYGRSKALGEEIVRDTDGRGVEWCIVRPTTVWGPWCNSHQRRFLELIRAGRYFHVGYRDRYKSYGYVGNICRQLCALMEADAARVSRKTLYLADYEPISLREWANAFQKELCAPRIRTFPVFLAKGAAAAGDLIVRSGGADFPFTSTRLRNILSEYVFDLTEAREIVAQLPCTMEEGVRETVRWLKTSP